MAGMKGELRKRKLLVIVGTVLAVAVLAAVVRGGRHREQQPVDHTVREIQATVITVASSDLPEMVTASGTVRPIVESRIAPKIMSNVAQVYVREGDRVRRGQPLIRLESRDLQAQVAQAQAGVAAASAGSARASTAVDLQRTQSSTGVATALAALRAANERLSMAREGARKQEKIQAHLAIAQAQARLKNALVERDRALRLVQDGAIARQQFDSAETSYEVAKAQYDSAVAQADLVDEGSRAQEIREAEAQVRQAEEALRMARASTLQNKMSSREAQVASSQVAQAHAALDLARVQLGYSVITSPISGVITARMVDPGDTVSPGTPVIAVEDNSVYRLEATVPDSVQDLYIGRRVTVTIGADEHTGEGRVSVVCPAGDANSHKYTVKVDLPQGLGAKSGTFGRISIPVGYTRGVLIPERALHDDGGLPTVFVMDHNDRAKMRIVKVGRKLNGGLEIISGLSSGDRVIVQNTDVLADGVRVRIEGS